MRKDYTKPTIAQVNLVPTEAVLHSCKTTLIAGPNSDLHGLSICVEEGGWGCFQNES